MASNQEEKSTELVETPAFYANMARVTITPYDLRLDFFQRKRTPEEKDQPQVSIYMSLEHSKSIAKIINEQLGILEKDFKIEVFDPLPALREKEKQAKKERSKSDGHKPEKK